MRYKRISWKKRYEEQENHLSKLISESCVYERDKNEAVERSSILQEERNRWEGNMNKCISLVLGYMNLHRNGKDDLCECNLCLTSKQLLELLGFKIGEKRGYVAPPSIRSQYIERNLEEMRLQIRRHLEKQEKLNQTKGDTK